MIHLSVFILRSAHTFSISNYATKLLIPMFIQGFLVFNCSRLGENVGSLSGLEIICRMQWSSLAGGHQEACTHKCSCGSQSTILQEGQGHSNCTVFIWDASNSQVLSYKQELLGLECMTTHFYHWITLFSVIQAQGHNFAQFYASPSIFVPSAILWSTFKVRLLFDTSPF